MKKTIIILLLLLSFASKTESAKFFALDYTKSKRAYTNNLMELNSQNGELVTQVKLSKSQRAPIEKLRLPISNYMFFYASIDKKTGKLEIVNKNDISSVKTVQIDSLNRTLVPYVGLKEFSYLTKDNQFLLLHTGLKKEQKITIIDVIRGEIFKQIPISRYKNSMEVSSDDNYLLVNNTSNDELTVINLNDFDVALTSNLGKYRAYATIHDNFLYLTKFKGKDRNKTYWIQALSLITKKKVDINVKSNSLPIFAVGSKSRQLFTLTNQENGKTGVLHKLIGSSIKNLATLPIKIKPEAMFVNEDFQQILVKGKGKIMTIKLSDLPNHSITKLPFDSIKYGYNDNGNLLYLKEGTGSKVAVIDVESGKLIERSGTGRPGVKFGQFMASVAIAGVGLNYGYWVYSARYSNTGFTLNSNQNKLYVINSKTNDVTHFNAHDLSDRKAIATGGSTFLVHQGDAPKAPLWVFSGKRINQINDNNFVLEKEIDYEQIIGFDMDEDYFIIRTEQDIQTYDMKTGNITNQWPLSTIQEVWTE